MRLSFSLLFWAFAAHAATADWIWSARYVVTMDARRDVIEDGAVAIVGDHIAAVGTRVPRSIKHGRRNSALDRPDAILTPGLINTHTHAAMSLFRGIADDLKLQDWLEKFIFPAEARNVTPNSCAGARAWRASKWRWAARPLTSICIISKTRSRRPLKEAGLRGDSGPDGHRLPRAGLQDSASRAGREPRSFFARFPTIL